MKIYRLFIFIFLAGIWSCNSPRMSSSYNPGNQNAYSTYTWVNGIQKADNPLYNSEIIDHNIKQAVDRELSNWGFLKIQKIRTFLSAIRPILRKM